jgi:two-component system, NarL family, sensor kinase
VRSVPREVLRFAVPGVVALLGVAGGSLWLAKTVSTDAAVRDARESTELLARGVVEPELTDALVDGDPAAVTRLDQVVRERVLSDEVVTVRLWRRDGTIVYSDEPRLVGDRYDLGEEELDVLDHGGAEAEVSDLAKPENRFERGFGELLEVYLPVQTPGGEPLLFEVYQRQSAIDSGARDVLDALAPVVVGPLILLMAIELPLAWRMARRLEQGRAEREVLLEQAIDSSEVERRRIAADLHDGVVQDLAGVSYTLAALAHTAESAGEEDQARRLAAAADETRRSVRSLRSLLVEIYPPNLTDTGLEGALSDLAASCCRNGTTTEVDVDAGVDLDEAAQAVVYRVAREALQNVGKHAQAGHVTVSLRPVPAGAELSVVDDGRGFDPDGVPEGHVGLRLLADLAREAGADLEVTSTVGAGTSVRLVVPS